MYDVCSTGEFWKFQDCGKVSRLPSFLCILLPSSQTVVLFIKMVSATVFQVSEGHWTLASFSCFLINLTLVSRSFINKKDPNSSKEPHSISLQRAYFKFYT